MRRFIAILAVATFFAGAIYAFAADVYTYEAKNGNVTFDHKMHADKLGDCAKCHQGEPGPIEMSKDFAHKEGCNDCHKAMGAPSKCNDCHKK